MKNIFIIGLLLVFAACNDFLEPRLSNELTQEQLYKNPASIANLVYTAYSSFSNVPDSWNNSFLDGATDNAVDSDINARISRMAGVVGDWNSSSSILNNWKKSYDNIRQVNLFLEIGLDPEVLYVKSDPIADSTFKARIKAEAYFLRAWIQFDLLRRFSGIDENGELKGFPVLTTVMRADNLVQLERNTFEECVNQIVADVDTALKAGLKDQWEPTSVYNSIIGDEAYGRPTNITCLALKSRVLLYAASPAYTVNLSDAEITTKYQNAAKAAYAAIQKMGATLPDVYTSNISSDFYNSPQNEELIMRVLAGNDGKTKDMATRNFPPATLLLGQGNCNPSQNLVDAFPMANGYPRNHANNMGYSDDNMYDNRDPRFYNTVLYNGALFKGVRLEMFPGGNCSAGAQNVDENESSRTGYYIRKWLSPIANLVAGDEGTDFHYNPIFRKVEMFLNFAEAANKAYGPQDATLGLSAVDAIREVRRRAGIAAGGDDNYLNEIAANTVEVEALIKNERRIELCFEGHRFFDLRRWKEDLNTSIQGVNVSNVAGTVSYQRKEVLKPVYEDYMYYGPLPLSELLKTENITQNRGWN